MRIWRQPLRRVSDAAGGAGIEAGAGAFAAQSGGPWRAGRAGSSIDHQALRSDVPEIVAALSHRARPRGLRRVLRGRRLTGRIDDLAVRLSGPGASS